MEWEQRLVPEHRARVRIGIRKLANGNMGNLKSVGDGVSELRIDYGPGYRVYVGLSGPNAYLIWGGNKSTQEADIAYAKRLWSKR
jgi:putative addiction module killer protein